MGEAPRHLGKMLGCTLRIPLQKHTENYRNKCLENISSLQLIYPQITDCSQLHRLTCIWRSLVIILYFLLLSSTDLAMWITFCIPHTHLHLSHCSKDNYLRPATHYLKF